MLKVVFMCLCIIFIALKEDVSAASPLRSRMLKNHFEVLADDPTESPTDAPSASPSQVPSQEPTQSPSQVPSEVPSQTPSQVPSEVPSQSPSEVPSQAPTASPSETPSQSPSASPSQDPSQTPSALPSEVPSQSPSVSPSEVPSQAPSVSPSEVPSQAPSAAPSQSPSVAPSQAPSQSPSQSPSQAPTQTPSQVPSQAPSQVPSETPSLAPTHAPTSTRPTSQPSVQPSSRPSSQPSLTPTSAPSYKAETWGQITWDKKRTRISGHCDNLCSGHGTCEKNVNCKCFEGMDGEPEYTGPDCSLRTCPKGNAWVGSVVNANDLHPWTECSNKGICDRATGVCDCFHGYDGVSCQRTVCPENCNYHGSCWSQKHFAEKASRVYNLPWDATKEVGCLCDAGYRGPACDLQECPSNADPLGGYGNEAGRECSGRGLCDYDTGMCSCFKGFYGSSCSYMQHVY